MSSTWVSGQLRELQRQLDHIKRAPAHLNPFDTTEQDIGQLQAEVTALRLSVNVLLNLLISKGITSSDEVDALIQSMLASILKPQNDSETLGSDNPFSDLGR